MTEKASCGATNCGSPLGDRDASEEVWRRFQRWTILLDADGASDFWDDIHWLMRRKSAESETASSDGRHRHELIADIVRLRKALGRIAIMDDEDCAHANDPKAMTRIAREALK